MSNGHCRAKYNALVSHNSPMHSRLYGEQTSERFHQFSIGFFSENMYTYIFLGQNIVKLIMHISEIYYYYVDDYSIFICKLKCRKTDESLWSGYERVTKRSMGFDALHSALVSQNKNGKTKHKKQMQMHRGPWNDIFENVYKNETIKSRRLERRRTDFRSRTSAAKKQRETGKNLGFIRFFHETYFVYIVFQASAVNSTR